MHLAYLSKTSNHISYINIRHGWQHTSCGIHDEIGDIVTDSSPLLILPGLVVPIGRSHILSHSGEANRVSGTVTQI